MHCKCSLIACPVASGVRLFAMNRFDPTIDKKATGVFAAPGHITDIILSPTHYQLISMKTDVFSQECYTPDSPRTKFEYLNIPYSLTACRIECTQSVARSECGCFLALDSRDLAEPYTEADVCTINTTVDCFFDKAQYEKRVQLVSECINQKCAIPCDSWQIDYSLSSLPLSPPGHDYLQQTSTIPTSGQGTLDVSDSGDGHVKDAPDPIDMIGESTQLPMQYDEPGEIRSTENTGTESLLLTTPEPRPAEMPREFKDLILIKVAYGELRYFEVKLN